MMLTLLRLPFIVMLALTQLRAADELLVTALRAADDARVTATVAGDRAKIAAILSEDLRYAHSNGVMDTKASMIDALMTGRLKYVAWDYEERSFTFPLPGMALMTGRARVTVAKPEGAADMTLTFLGVWREEKGHWRFLAWQSGRLPDPAARK